MLYTWLVLLRTPHRMKRDADTKYFTSAKNGLNMGELGCERYEYPGVKNQNHLHYHHRHWSILYLQRAWSDTSAYYFSQLLHPVLTNHAIDSPPHSQLVSTRQDLDSASQSRKSTTSLSFSQMISVVDQCRIHPVPLSLAKQTPNSKELISWEPNVLW